MIRALAILCLTATPAISTEYMHCYLGEGPEDAVPSSEYNLSNLMEPLFVASLRHACGSDTSADQKMLDAMVAAGQCSPESEISGFVRETFLLPPADILAELEADSSKEDVAALCEIVEESCTPGEVGYDEACVPAIDAAMGG